MLLEQVNGGGELRLVARLMRCGVFFIPGMSECFDEG